MIVFFLPMKNLNTCCSPVSHKNIQIFIPFSFEVCEQESTQVSVKRCFIKNLLIFIKKTLIF